MLQVIVRAIPAMGFEHRHRAGRKWSKDPTRVSVVENPSGPGEISPAQLEAIRKDRMMAIEPVGDGSGGAGDMLALNEARANMADLEKQLTEARREIAGYREYEKDAQARFRRDMEDAGREVGELRGKLETAQAECKRLGMRVKELEEATPEPEEAEPEHHSKKKK